MRFREFHLPKLICISINLKLEIFISRKENRSIINSKKINLSIAFLKHRKLYNLIFGGIRSTIFISSSESRLTITRSIHPVITWFYKISSHIESRSIKLFFKRSQGLRSMNWMKRRNSNVLTSTQKQKRKDRWGCARLTRELCHPNSI